MFSPCHAAQEAHENTPRSVIGTRRNAVRVSRMIPNAISPTNATPSKSFSVRVKNQLSFIPVVVSKPISGLALPARWRSRFGGENISHQVRNSQLIVDKKLTGSRGKAVFWRGF
jgi:hypothetical protein